VNALREEGGSIWREEETEKRSGDRLCSNVVEVELEELER